jgi:ADP-ribosylglycohydrolase
MNQLQDRIRGSLLGGAIGDALGYPVEFIYSYEGILSRYGERGITRLDTKQYSSEGEQNNKAVVSDDTQMTLFTANGLLNAPKLGIEPKYAICRAYLEWLETQSGNRKGKAECWIRNLPELNQRRAPGTTCISALQEIKRGIEPINNSKGCGGVMRVAPVALYAVCGNRMSITDADRLAGDAAEITHQHPLGFISAALMVHVIYRLAQDEHPTRSVLKNYITEGVEVMRELYGSHYNDVERMAELSERAIFLSSNADSDLENIKCLGEGWVGEEALAIGLYYTLKYLDNFEEAMIASVNHGGDSDSTGAVTGNILGAAIGYEAIPKFYKEDVELHDVLLHMADDLCLGEVTKYQK